MTRAARLLFALALLLLVGAYRLPLWHIALKAPQYPEGLGLYISIDRIVGERPQDLTSINNLNHYIGMKRITPEGIPELRLMPALLAGLIAAGLPVALLGLRPMLYLWTGLFVAGLFAGLADFWRWGYDYGHNLDPEAIIRIPGMTYQPPLIGGKQLLNFHASSWPASGGWLALGALFIALGLCLVAWRTAHQLNRASPAPSGSPWPSIPAL